MSSKDFESEVTTDFKGPGPILRPQRLPPPPPTETPRPLPNFEAENPSTPNIEVPTLLFQFTDLFDNFDNGKIRKRIIDRTLNECPFKTVLWRSFLHCLPADSTKWSGALEDSRTTYDELADRYNIELDDLSEKTKHNQTDDHPLSQEEESLWSKSFQYQELRDNLVQDVRRTFPELSFFHQKKMQNLLIKVLLIYSLKHEKTFPYRQGMHEILAVIVFNIYAEATRVNDYPESNDLMKLIYDLRYLEHDAFSIYEKVMEHLQPFYDIRKENSAKKHAMTTDKSGVHTGPLSETESRVNNIVNRLRHFDESIDQKLKELDIEPSIYGIRWLRLLFGREIAFGMIPNLWTLIFCYDNNFGFVDFFFLALLIERAKTLTTKRSSMCFSSSLQTLLPNEVISDPEKIICHALMMAEKSPRTFNLPSNPTVLNGSNPFGFGQDNGVRAKDASLFTSFTNRFVANENSKSLPSMSNRSKIFSSDLRETELQDEPGKETRKQVEENIELQRIVTNLIDHNLEKLDNALKKNSITDDNDVALRIRNCITGVEYINNVLKGQTTFDKNFLQQFLPMNDEKETINN